MMVVKGPRHEVSRYLIGNSNQGEHGLRAIGMVYFAVSPDFGSCMASEP